MYQIIDGDFHSEDESTYHSYGLKTPNGVCINDITVEFDKIQHFVSKLNCLDVSELHLMDMIIDLIG